MQKTAYFYAFFILSCTLEAANIVFDLGDVLVYSNKFRISYDIGWGNFLGYAIFDFQNPANIEDKMFDVLDTLGKQTSKNNLYALNEGRRLPQIMCDWLMGIKSTQEILNIVKNKMEELDEKGYFKSSREKKLIRRVIKTVFDPYAFAHSTNIKNQGLDLLKKVSKDKNNKLYILSNWDPESYDLLLAIPEIKKLFSYFLPENIVISGKIKMMKPADDIYQYLLKHYKLNPKETILIDDMAENIAGAERAGIHGIQLVHNDYEAVEEELDLLLVEINKKY